eukprot:c10223_g2_i1 orf=84-392(+)
MPWPLVGDGVRADKIAPRNQGKLWVIIVFLCFLMGRYNQPIHYKEKKEGNQHTQMKWGDNLPGSLYATYGARQRALVCSLAGMQGVMQTPPSHSTFKTIPSY